MPEDDGPFRKLYSLAVENDVELEQMMRLVMGLFEAQTGRPTRRAPASSAGRPNTSPSSSTSSHLRSVDSLIRGEEKTVQVESGDSGTVEMGDGQLMQLVPSAELTG